MTYFIKDYSFSGRLYSGTIQAESPKEALRKYLLLYRSDKTTINCVRKAVSAKYSDYKVVCTETGYYNYYILM